MPRFLIAGIGGSAGSLEALKAFFANVPIDSGIGYVVVTHMHPDYNSHLPEILGKASPIPIHAAKGGTVVAPDNGYIAEPGGLLTIVDGILQWAPQETTTKTPHLPIDHFLRSLAADRHEHAVCVVLSGTGTDATLGMRAVKAEAGVAMVQKPMSAGYAGMPSSALATGLADYVLEPQNMPRQLIEYARGPYVKPPVPAAETAGFPLNELQKIYQQLRIKTGHDFSSYKPSTICRRIERRMNIHQIKRPEDYVHYLQEDFGESHLLFKELLIGVTSFFRDSEAFETLAGTILPAFLTSRPPGQMLRVWIPGCSTGEEAYTIAIILHESLTRLDRPVAVQVFATDLDAHAIEIARAGVFPAGISADISPKRLERYFTRLDGRYRICKEIRDMIIFAPQNVLSDPPFTRLDLITCRNLLIYLDSSIQKRLMRIFHYALSDGGLMMLGHSESIGSLTGTFETVADTAKIYRRKNIPDERLYLVVQPVTAERENKMDSKNTMAQSAKRPPSTSPMEKLLLNRFAPASVIIDSRGTILYAHGRTGAYLEPEQGQPRNNILEMGRQGLVPALRSAMGAAMTGKCDQVRRNVKVKTNGEYTYIDLTVSPIQDPEMVSGLLLVTFSPVTLPHSPERAGQDRDAKKKSATGGRAQVRQDELRHIKASYQGAQEELEMTNNALVSANEELQSTNEELQSTNEEIEVSREEMQSLNEELSTVNAELQVKVGELSGAQDYMLNLLESTGQAIVFLDSSLNIRRFTEHARDLFRLIDTDVGRQITDMASNLEYHNLVSDCNEVVNTLVHKSIEVRTRGGEWRLLVIMPYRTIDKLVDGLVLAFNPIDREKKAELEALGARNFFESVVQTLREPLLVLDAQNRIVSVNETFSREFALPADDAPGKLLYEIDEGRWNVPELRRLLEEILPENTVLSDFRMSMEHPRRGAIAVVLNARRLEQQSEQPPLILLAMEIAETGSP